MRTVAKLYWNGINIPFSRANVTLKEGVKDNSLSVDFDNPSLYTSSTGIKFSIEDTIELFAMNDRDGNTLDVTSTSPNLIFSGKIKEMSFDDDSSKQKFSITCVDRAYDLFNRVWGQTWSNVSTPQIVYELMSWMARSSSGVATFTVQYDAVAPYTNGIQSKRPDGSDFPTKSFGASLKPIYEFLDSLSSPDYTNTDAELLSDATTICKRTMKYYLGRNNVFHWFYPTDTPTYEMSVGVTTPVGSDTRSYNIKSVKMKYGVLEEINFIIAKCGLDMNDVQILWYDLDDTAKSLNRKDSFRDWSDIARTMKAEDYKAGNITFINGESYNYPSNYPMHPEWMDGTATVANDSEYNDKFRTYAMKRMESRADSIFEKTQGMRWKGTISLIGMPFEPTELISFTHGTFGINKKLRIKSVSHTIDKSSFTTSLDVEEDIGVA